MRAVRFLVAVLGLVVCSAVLAQTTVGGPGILVPQLSITQANGLYCELAGCTMSGEFKTSAGTFESTVADGTDGFVFDVSTAHTSGVLFGIREAGGANLWSINAVGTMIGGSGVLTTLNANTSISNSTASSGCTASNGALCVLDDLELDGIFYFEETTTPSAIANYGALYTKNDNVLYFQTGAGAETVIGGVPTFKSYSFGATTTGVHYIGGFYAAPAADANLNQGALTVTYGDAGDDEPWGAHAFAVCAGDGATDGSDLTLTVSGTSVTDAGVRTASDSEEVVADGVGCTENTFFETGKKWVGQITYTLASSGGTTFNLSFNYGFNKYEDFGNRAFTLTDIECIGHAGASNSLEIELIHQKATGWDYDAAAFVPGAAAIYKMTTDYSGPEDELTAGGYVAWKRASLSTAIAGNDSEGLLIRLTTGANNVIEHMTCHIGVQL